MKTIKPGKPKTDAQIEYQNYHNGLKAKLKALFDDDESLGHVMEAMGEVCRDYGNQDDGKHPMFQWWEQMRVMMIACEKMTEHFEEG